MIVNGCYGVFVFDQFILMIQTIVSGWYVEKYIDGATLPLWWVTIIHFQLRNYIFPRRSLHKRFKHSSWLWTNVKHNVNGHDWGVAIPWFITVDLLVDDLYTDVAIFMPPESLIAQSHGARSVLASATGRVARSHDPQSDLQNLAFPCVRSGPSTLVLTAGTFTCGMLEPSSCSAHTRLQRKASGLFCVTPISHAKSNLKRCWSAFANYSELRIPLPHCATWTKQVLRFVGMSGVRCSHQLRRRQQPSADADMPAPTLWTYKKCPETGENWWW